jgi:hypothetical protein
MVADSIQLTPLHPRCPTYVLRKGVEGLSRADRVVSLQLDDLIVAGTTVIGVRSPE